MCFLTVDEPVSNKTPEAVWGIVCDNAATILNRLVKKDRSSKVKLSIYCCTLWCSPMVMGWKWAKGQCCRGKRLKWGSSGEWMVSALEIGLRSLDIGEELKEELLPLWQWKEPIEVVQVSDEDAFRTNPFRGVLEGLHYISYPPWEHFSPQRGKYCKAEGDLK